MKVSEELKSIEISLNTAGISGNGMSGNGMSGNGFEFISEFSLADFEKELANFV